MSQQLSTAELSATYNDAFNFANRAHAVLEQNVVFGESNAVTTYLASLVMGGSNGMGMLVFGPSGTGKSRLLDYGHMIFGDLSEDEIATIPHRDDLTPTELVGQESTMTRTRIVDGHEEAEIIRSKVEPILKPGIKIVKADEVNRTSPYALNAALGILQKGSIDVYNDGTRKRLYSDGFEQVLFALNNYGTNYTFSLDPALKGRIAMGAHMGHRKKGALSKAAEHTIDNDNDVYEQRPEFDPVTKLDDIHRYREVIPSVHIPKETRDRLKPLVASMLDEFVDAGIEIGDGRISSQLKRIARTFALLSGTEKVNDAVMQQAVRSAMFGRLSGDGTPTEEIYERTDSAILRGLGKAA